MRQVQLTHDDSRLNARISRYDEYVACALDKSAMTPHNVTKPYGYNDHLRDIEQRGDWYGGVHSNAEAVRLYEAGWVEGVRKAMALKDRLAREIPPPVSIRRRPTWTDEGDELDHDRLRAGQIDSMWRVAKRRHGRGPRTISIAGQIGGSAFRRPEELFYSGACALVLADLLEEAGYRVELLATTFTSGHSGANEDDGDVIQIKAPSEPLRVDAAVFALAHAAFFRHFVLLNMSRMPGRIGMAYGVPQDAEPYLDTLARAGEIQKPDVFFEYFSDERGTIEAIRSALDTIQTGEGVRVA